ncbi:efflux RND transporter permease subunit [Pseudolysobacter antarcticus]|uniref:Efflux RND transporter permease subunit n=1 Tax=Pseudolysobacter antarcticus TaxID=2511995 RepID=A0A411HGD1_9GAMM|nr:efflux RND transporter permease subunit [Pseudolysobacter antarcticus]QBB69552.1 efflux RND transporter permease subunit [Pseudolysobacter antarcticus]
MNDSWLERHRRSILLLVLILALGGFFSAWRLPVGLFPLIDFPRIVVSVDAGDRPADRMVTEVTRPLELALRGVPKVEKIRSTSSRGSAEVSLTLGWGTDMVAAQLQMEAAVNRLLPKLPPGTTFTTRRMDPTVFPSLGLTLISKTDDLVALRDFATYQLKPAILAIGGVIDAEVLGGRQAEYQVLLDPLRLQAVGLTSAEVTRMLAANNEVMAVGRIEDNYRLYLTIVDTRLHNLDDIRRSIVKTEKSAVVTLADIADVRLGQQPEWTRVNANGHDAVLINIRQQRGANTVALVSDVRDLLAKMQAQVPTDIQVGTFYDQSELIVSSASGVRDAIIIGAILAALILFVFFRSLRLTLVIALVLPVVICISVLLLGLLHMSFNIMTLGGIAAAVGLIVDDAVVLLEHTVRRIGEARSSAMEITLQAAREMFRPLTGSSLATIVVFVPLSFLSGITGGFFKALALTMVASLIVSYLVALLAVPLLTHRLVTQEDAQRLEKIGPRLQRAQDIYAHRMQMWLLRPWWALLIVGGCVVVGWLAYAKLGSGFMPKMDEGGFILDYVAAPGTSLSETDRLLRKVETLITASPDVASYSRRTGLQLGGGLSEANEGDFFIRLKSGHRRGIEAVMTELREHVETEIPGLRIETAQLMEDLLGDLIASPQPIEVKLFGADPAKLRNSGKLVAQAIGKFSGIVEVFDGVKIAGDAIDVQIDRTAAALEGIDPETISRQLDTALEGSIGGSIQSGEKLINVRLWTPGDLRQRIAQIEQLPLSASDGHTLPLKRIASVQISKGQAQINRENLRPMVAVTARLEGRDLGSAMRDVQAAVRQLKLPAQVGIEYGGLYQQQQSSFQDLTIVFIAAVLLITVLLMFLYESMSIVLSLLITTFCSLTGVLLGLWITGTELNISSLMGMTMILGIVTEVGIFYFAELDIATSHTHDQLIVAGVKRMRPIVMTSSIAILALLPLAVNFGSGASMQQPLAISIVAGLIFAVPLVLLLMPALYALLSKTARA